MKPRILFLLLVVAFIFFSANIYLKPASVSNGAVDESIKKASVGRLVWQKYNCQSCHQLYGLGGYLGPDLTNVYSTAGKSEQYIKAMIKSGVAQMPAFNLSEEEQENIVAFLKMTDASGSANPRNFKILNTGMIEAR